VYRHANAAAVPYRSARKLCPDSKLFKSIQTPHACLTYFHLRKTSVVCVLEDMLTSFPYISIVFFSVKTLLFPDAYFIFLQLLTSVHDSFWCFFLSFFPFFRHLRLSFVVFTNKGISLSDFVSITAYYFRFDIF